MPYYAKRSEKCKIYQTITGHEQDTLDVLDFNLSVIKRIGYFDLKDIEKAAKAAALLHDVGKYSEGFQKELINGGNTALYAHAFTGSVTAYRIFKHNFEDSVARAAAIAIQAHHTQLHGQAGENPKPTYNCVYSEEAIDQQSKLLETIGIRIPDTAFNRVSPQDIERYSNDHKYAIQYRNQRPSADIPPEEAFKSLYASILYSITKADGEASGNFEKVSKEYSGDEKVFGRLYPVRQQRPSLTAEVVLKQNHTFYSYQKEAAQYSGNILIKAPCGRGKTEAAVMWAKQILKRDDIDHVIFVMPTRVTSNAMALRLKEYFGAGNVNVYHSGDLNINKELSNNDEIEPTHCLSAFHSPVTVTTLDHLLLSFVHGYKYADRAEGGVLRSAIIIDEVHAYDKLMVSNLLAALPLFKKYKIPHLIMTGTLPDTLKQSIMSVNEYGLIVDNEGMSYTPFTIMKEPRPITVDNEADQSFIDNVLSLYNAGHKQMIVTNTVARAQAVYYALRKAGIPDDSRCILHSRYTAKDRLEHEKVVINTPKDWNGVIVSTQVCELSLDIEGVTHLHSELCPVDALGQRAGRCNRKGKTPEGVVHVYPLENGKNLPYDEKVLESTGQVITEGPTDYDTINRWCSSIYSKPFEKDRSYGEVSHICTPFGYTPQQVHGDESSPDPNALIRLRESGSNDIYAIPKCVMDSLDNKGLPPDDEYLVPIPVYMIKQTNEITTRFNKATKTNYLIVDIGYEPELGLSIYHPGERNIIIGFDAE